MSLLRTLSLLVLLILGMIGFDTAPAAGDLSHPVAQLSTCAPLAETWRQPAAPACRRPLAAGEDLSRG